MDKESEAKLENNIYIQYEGNRLGNFGKNPAPMMMFDESAEDVIKNTYGDKGAKVYWVKK